MNLLVHQHPTSSVQRSIARELQEEFHSDVGFIPELADCDLKGVARRGAVLILKPNFPTIALSVI